MGTTDFVTITANLQDLTGSVDGGGWVIFALVGYGNDLPRVAGGVVITNLTVKAVANAMGVLSQTVIANDVITPSGTSYQVSIYNDTGSWLSTTQYQFTSGSGTVDLSTLAAL